MKTSQNVALRYAMEHASPEALKEYLQDHPKADPAKHTIVERDISEGPSEDEHKDDHGHGHHPKFLGGLRGLVKKLKNAPAAVKKFVQDAEHRKEVTSKSAEGIKKSPKSYVQKLVKVLKHEGQEFKDAFAGVSGLMKGKKPTPEQKHAIKTVATHLAITGAAVALSGAGPALAATAAGKAIARHIALKAVSEVMGDLHILDEFGHIGHGLMHIMEKLAAEEDKKDFSPEEALSALVMKKIQEQLEKGISEKDILESLKDVEFEDEDSEASDKTAQSVARRFIAAQDPNKALRGVLVELKKLQAWTRGFDAAYRASQKSSEGAPDGYVWQDDWVEFWYPFNPIQRKLYSYQESLEALGGDYATDVEAYIEPPRAARIDEVLDNPKFAERDGVDHIIYSKKDLQEWYKAFSWWVDYSVKGVQTLLKEI
jgi:hypothetical protein